MITDPKEFLLARPILHNSFRNLILNGSSKGVVELRWYMLRCFRLHYGDSWCGLEAKNKYFGMCYNLEMMSFETCFQFVAKSILKEKLSTIKTIPKDYFTMYDLIVRLGLIHYPFSFIVDKINNLEIP